MPIVAFAHPATIGCLSECSEDEELLLLREVFKCH
jgi:hypothetical protein